VRGGRQVTVWGLAGSGGTGYCMPGELGEGGGGLVRVVTRCRRRPDRVAVHVASRSGTKSSEHALSMLAESHSQGPRDGSRMSEQRASKQQDEWPGRAVGQRQSSVRQ
jgi:hypothetical protein